MLSVVIPLAPDETELPELVSQLQSLPSDSEIILAYDEHAAKPKSGARNLCVKPRAISVSSGRAGQMNAAAKSAKGDYLWFLHADSRLDANTISALLECINQEEDALYYHDLAFLPDGPSTMPINAWGVKFRSNWLKTPFGDQGFCVRREVFYQIGRYCEDAPYGEDHLLVWQALQAGVPVRSTGARLFTSARKYSKNGWLKTTLKHIYLWAVQAAPELVTLLRKRLS